MGGVFGASTTLQIYKGHVRFSADPAPTAPAILVRPICGGSE